MRKVKSGKILYSTLIQFIISAVILILFLTATLQKGDSRGVKQQVIEKQIALLVDSAKPGMSFKINKYSPHSIINGLRIEKGKIYCDVDGLISFKGYSYISRYNVKVTENELDYVIEVRE